jgi:hypothetical protein
MKRLFGKDGQDIEDSQSCDVFWNEEASYASMCDPSTMNHFLRAPHTHASVIEGEATGTQPSTIAGGGCFQDLNSSF